MSRPIYEPSLARADQALAWGSRQLFRRPAPTSPTGERPWAYMFWGDGGTVPNNDGTAFGLVPPSDAYVNDAGLFVGSSFPPAQVLTPDFDNNQINLNHVGKGYTGGYYAVHVVVVWNGDPAAGSLTAGIGVEGSELLAGPIFSSSMYDASDVLTDSVNQAITHTAHHIQVADENTLGPYINQNTGGDLDWTELRFYVIQLETYDESTGQFYPITS